MAMGVDAPCSYNHASSSRTRPRDSSTPYAQVDRHDEKEHKHNVCTGVRCCVACGFVLRLLRFHVEEAQALWRNCRRRRPGADEGTILKPGLQHPVGYSGGTSRRQHFMLDLVGRDSVGRELGHRSRSRRKKKRKWKLHTQASPDPDAAACQLLEDVELDSTASSSSGEDDNVAGTRPARLAVQQRNAAGTGQQAAQKQQQEQDEKKVPMLSSRGAPANANDNPSAGAPPRKADEDDEDYFRAVYVAANANATPEEGEQSHFAIPLQWACSCASNNSTSRSQERRGDHDEDEDAKNHCTCVSCCLLHCDRDLLSTAEHELAHHYNYNFQPADVDRFSGRKVEVVVAVEDQDEHEDEDVVTGGAGGPGAGAGGGGAETESTASSSGPTSTSSSSSRDATKLKLLRRRIIPTRAELEREVGELLENAEQQELLYASGKKSRPLHQRSAAYDSTTYLYRLGIVLASSASKDIPILTGGFFLYRFLVWLPLTLIGWVKTNCYRRTAQVVRAKIAVGEAGGGGGAGVLRAGKVKDEGGGRGPLSELGQVGQRRKKPAGPDGTGGAGVWGEKEEEEDSFTTMWDRIVESERQKDLLLRPQGRGDDPAVNQSDDADRQPAGKPSSRTSDRRASLLEMHGRAASGIMRSVAEHEEPDAAPLAGATPSRSAITAEWIWPRGTTLHGPAVDHHHVEHDYKSKKVVFYIHGGAFILCNSQTHRYATVTVVQLSGCILFSPNYRKPPTVPLDVSIQDCCEAYLHLVEDFKVPAARICVMGDSAGAALGLQLILQIRGKGEIWQRVLRNRKQRQMEMAEVGPMKRGEIEIDDRPAARRGPDVAPHDEPDHRTPTATCLITKKNSTFMPGSAILVSPWVDPSSTCGRSFLVNSHLDIFRVETVRRFANALVSSSSSSPLRGSRAGGPAGAIIPQEKKQPAGGAGGGAPRAAEEDVLRSSNNHQSLRLTLKHPWINVREHVEEAFGVATASTPTPTASCTRKTTQETALEKLPPMLVVVGERELLRDQICRFAKRLTLLSAAPVRLEIYQDMCHVFPGLYGAHGTPNHAFENMVRFLNRE